MIYYYLPILFPLCNVSQTSVNIFRPEEDQKFERSTLGSSFFLLVWPPRSQSLLIMVWCSSKTDHRLRIPLDSGPIFWLANFTVRRWSGPPFFLPPPESPGLPVPCSLPVSSLSFTSSPSVSFSRPPPFPPQQRLIPRRPFSGVPLRWTQQIKQPAPGGGSGAPRSWRVTALCGWWYLALVWVWGGVEDGAPRDCP